MPMHDWNRVDSTLYPHFHQRWCVAIADVLNAGLLPTGLSALIEQHSGGVVPDVLTVERRRPQSPRTTGSTTIPTTRMTIEASANALVRRANRIAIRHRLGEVVCIIEIISPGNKSSRSAVRSVVEKTHEFLRAGVNVLLVDPFPPGPRDPQSLHKLIWDELEDVPFEMPAEEPLLMASYKAGDDAVGRVPVAYLEPFRVGVVLRNMPAWIDPDTFVEVPFERAYQMAWDSCPSDFRYLVEHGKLPDE